MTELQMKQLEELKNDVEYYNKLDFVELSKKFKRDLTLIESLIKELKEKTT